MKKKTSEWLFTQKVFKNKHKNKKMNHAEAEERLNSALEYQATQKDDVKLKKKRVKVHL